MTSFVFGHAKFLIGAALLNLTKDPLMAVLTASTRADITPTARAIKDFHRALAGPAVLLRGQTWTPAARLKADQVTFRSPLFDADSIVVFRDSGDHATSVPIVYLSGIQVSATAGPVPVEWPEIGIFHL